MYNVPPKFNQLCRLCLSVVGNDSAAKNLLIFDTADDNVQFKQGQGKCKRRNQALSISAISSDTNNFDSKSARSKVSSQASVSDDDDDEKTAADDSQDISKRILMCLQLKVT